MDNLHRRTSTFILSGFVIVLLILLAGLYWIGDRSTDPFDVIVAIIAFGVLCLLYVNGWPYASLATTLVVDLLAACRLPTGDQYIAVVVPVLVAFTLTNMRWMLFSASSVYLILLLRAGFTGPYTNLGAIATYSIIVGALCIARYRLDIISSMVENSVDFVPFGEVAQTVVLKVSDALTSALGYLDLFASTTPIARNEQDLERAQVELEHLANLIHQLRETAPYEGR